MELQTAIFIGRSGSGKGTQAKLLRDVLTQEDKQEVFYLESGEHFRAFLKENGYTQDIARMIAGTGGLQPTFLAVHVWAHLFIENLKENNHIIIDGTPRTLDEARVLHSAMQFYGREKPVVIYLNVSREEAQRRLEARGRADDNTKEEITQRLDWFDSDVYPVVEYYRDHPEYIFADVDGEQDIEAIHTDIMKYIRQ